MPEETPRHRAAVVVGIALIGALASFGSTMLLREGEADRLEFDLQKSLERKQIEHSAQIYERINQQDALIEDMKQRHNAAVEELLALRKTNQQLLWEIGLLQELIASGQKIPAASAVFSLIDRLRVPAWCKSVLYADDGEVSVVIAHVNSWYGAQTGLTRSYVVGKTDHDIFPKEVADVYLKHDLEVLNRRTWADYREPVIDSGGDTEYRRFWRFHNPIMEGGIELLCGWEIPSDEQKITQAVFHAVE